MKTIENKGLERIYRKEAVEKVFNSLDYQRLLGFSAISVGLTPWKKYKEDFKEGD